MKLIKKMNNSCIRVFLHALDTRANLDKPLTPAEFEREKLEHGSKF